MKKAEILSIGDEILIGQIVNNNAAFIGRLLPSTGFYPEWMTVVRDEPDNIREAFDAAMNRADLVVVTGGLGPTHDDITRGVAVDYFGTELLQDERLEMHVRSLYAARGREVPESARNQMVFPKGAVMVHNPLGTAAGIIFQKNDRRMILLPGVPFEMKRMMQESVIPFLHSLKIRESIRFLTVHTTGIPESFLFEKLDNLDRILEEVKVAFLPGSTGVDIRLSAAAEDAGASLRRIENALELLRSKISPHIIGLDDEKMENQVVSLLREKRMTVALAESCTGGLLSSRFTDIPGSSDVFMLGVVAYSNDAKRELLGVPRELIDRYGAVSAEVAAEMAAGVRNRLNTDLGLSTTGIAGPGGGSDAKPVGLVHLALSSRETQITERHVMTQDRLTNKMRFAQAALKLLLTYLQS